MFDQADFLTETAKSEKMEAFEIKVDELFDFIVNAMLDDLAFEKLEIGLNRRIGGRKHGDKSNYIKTISQV